ncbi:MAG: endonuclease/exonuclease/phosphatase family protein [Deltaproteobacteria bacterium]|nr:endonuclease/exonuclease/phosphatase family protein [Deltaproteobacteria bacterium]
MGRRLFLRGLLALLAGAGLVALGPYAWSRARVGRAQLVVHRLGQPRAPRAPGQLRVATWNIAHLRGLPEDNWAPTAAERDRRATDIAAVLRELDADVVVLTEVDFDASWSGRVDQARVIAERAGYPIVVEQRDLDFCLGWVCWRFGNAVLSRVELKDASVIDLPGFSELEEAVAGKKRGALVTLELPDGAVRLAGVHLCHRSEEVRTASASQLDLLAAQGPPLIVVGDLNAAPTGFPHAERTRDGFSAFRIFDGNGRFSRAPAGGSPAAADLTWPAAAPDRVLDWILVPTGWHHVGYRAVPSLLSDHLPLVSDVVRTSDAPAP